VSSIPGSNTLFEGQQINGQTHREETPIEEREKRRHTHRKEIKDADQGRSKQQNQRRTRTAPRHNVRGTEFIVNRDCSDD
jgi:hypothetical protein